MASSESWFWPSVHPGVGVAGGPAADITLTVELIHMPDTFESILELKAMKSCGQDIPWEIARTALSSSTSANSTVAALKTVIMDPIPKEITEGDNLLLAGLFCGPRVERISILLCPTCDDTVDVENPVIKIESKVTESIGNGQRFEAQLQAPRGTFNIIVFPVIEGEGNPVTLEVHRIEVISAE